jgi:hypothetical protein
MRRFKMIVFTNPVENREEEYNQWYTSRHIHEVLTVPGIVSGQRFRFRNGNDRWGYVALYDLETDHPESIIPEIRKRTGDGTFLVSDAISYDGLYSGIFEPITEVVTR